MGYPRSHSRKIKFTNFIVAIHDDFQRSHRTRRNSRSWYTQQLVASGRMVFPRVEDIGRGFSTFLPSWRARGRSTVRWRIATKFDQSNTSHLLRNFPNWNSHCGIMNITLHAQRHHLSLSVTKFVLQSSFYERGRCYTHWVDHNTERTRTMLPVMKYEQYCIDPK